MAIRYVNLFQLFMTMVTVLYILRWPTLQTYGPRSGLHDKIIVWHAFKYISRCIKQTTFSCRIRVKFCFISIFSFEVLKYLYLFFATLCVAEQTGLRFNLSQILLTIAHTASGFYCMYMHKGLFSLIAHISSPHIVQ